MIERVRGNVQAFASSVGNLHSLVAADAADAAQRSLAADPCGQHGLTFCHRCRKAQLVIVAAVERKFTLYLQ